jgi:AAA domain
LWTIAVSNQKPPSTSPPPWAEHLYRVLLVGPGSPGSASAWLGFRGGDRGLLDVFTDNVHLGNLTRYTRVPNVDIVPGSPWLVGADKALAAEVGAETLLRTSFARLPSRWDYMVVDGPRSLGFLAISAFVACQSLLIPVETRVMALGGLAALLRTMERVRERLNSELSLVGHALGERRPIQAIFSEPFVRGDHFKSQWSAWWSHRERVRSQALGAATNNPCEVAASRRRGSNVTTVAASASSAVARWSASSARNGIVIDSISRSARR